MIKKILLAILLMVAILNADSKSITIYKSPSCGCCSAWAEELQKAGYKVKEVNSRNVTGIKRKLGIEPSLRSCHTAIIDGYILEGHVPLSAISKLLKEKPKDIHALSVPGMPIGSLGMEVGNQKDKYNVIAIKKNKETIIYESH